jgi:hypothetical protein
MRLYGVLEQDAIILSRYIFHCVIVFGIIMLNIKFYGLYPFLILFVSPRLVSRI